MRTVIKSLLASITALAVSGCMNMPQDGRNSLATTTSLAYFPKKTQTQSLLNQMPAPQRQLAIGVYGFTDQTGQFKPSDVGQTLSRHDPGRRRDAGQGAVGHRQPHRRRR